jgi:hypothetical protein
MMNDEQGIRFQETKGGTNGGKGEDKKEERMESREKRVENSEENISIFQVTFLFFV